MTFLAMIIALLLLSVWGTAGRVQSDDWFRALQSQLAGSGLLPGVRLAVAILLPALLAHWLLGAAESLLFGLLWIAAAVLLLLYAFGRGDFHQHTARYRGYCRSADFEGAYLYASAELGLEGDTEVPLSAREAGDQIQSRLLYLGYERLFAVLFYYVLLGPAGAVAYRLLQLCRDTFEPGLARGLLFYLDWIPARLMAAAFALTGNFITSRDELLSLLTDARADAEQVLYRVGEAALGAASPGEPELEVDGEEAASRCDDFAGLQSRSLAAWIGLLALLVVLG